MGTWTGRRLCLLALGLFFILPTPAWALGGRDEGGTTPPALSGDVRKDWSALLGRGTRAGIPETRLEATTARLAAAGVDPQAGRALLDPAFEAAESGLPAGLVLAKLDEGALKGVPAEALERAARTRLDALTRARQVLAERGYPDPRERGMGLLISTALALESGLPEPALATALERGRGKPLGHVKATVEAGEALHLAGLDSATVEGLMADCLDRNLRRPELLRVVRFAREKHGQGVEGSALREALWQSGEAARTMRGAGHGGRGGAGGNAFGQPGRPGGGRGGHR